MIFGKIFDLLDHFSQEDLDRLQEVFDTLKPYFLRNRLTPMVSRSACVFFWIADILYS